MGDRVDSIILQISAAGDASEKEKELRADGLTPIVLFANGPERPFLLAARRQDLDAAFAKSVALAEGLGAERLAQRMRAFDDIAFAVETEMKYVSESEFPNLALFMLVEALHQYGFEGPDALRACAVRYDKNRLEDPDFGEPPSATEDI